MDDWLNRYRVFPRVFTSIFVILFVHMHFTVIEWVRAGWLEGEIFMSVYVASMTTGVIGLVATTQKMRIES